MTNTIIHNLADIAEKNPKISKTLIGAIKYIMELEDELKSAEKAASDAAWERDGDRMGGQFSQEEINRSNEWR